MILRKAVQFLRSNHCVLLTCFFLVSSEPSVGVLEVYLLESCFWSCRTRAAVCCCCWVCCKPCLGNCSCDRRKREVSPWYPSQMTVETGSRGQDKGVYTLVYISWTSGVLDPFKTYSPSSYLGFTWRVLIKESTLQWCPSGSNILVISPFTNWLIGITMLQTIFIGKMKALWSGHSFKHRGPALLEGR